MVVYFSCLRRSPEKMGPGAMQVLKDVLRDPDFFFLVLGWGGVLSRSLHTPKLTGEQRHRLGVCVCVLGGSASSMPALLLSSCEALDRSSHLSETQSSPPLEGQGGTRSSSDIS